MLLQARRMRGQTIVQVLFVVGLIGLLVAILLPSVRVTREPVRRTECSNKLRQLSLALLNYEDKYRCLPPGAILSDPHQAPKDFRDPNWGHTAFAMVMPFMEAAGSYSELDFDHDNRSEAVANSGDGAPLSSTLSGMVCPSSERARPASGPDDLNGIYAKGNFGLNCGGGFANHEPGSTGKLRGPFSIRSPLSTTLKEILDGTSNTVLASEILVVEDDDDGRGCWGRVGGAIVSGHTSVIDQHVCTPNSPAIDRAGRLLATADRPIHCGKVQDGEMKMCEDAFGFTRGGLVPRSRHPSGVNAALSDASVSYILNDVDPIVWRSALTIAGRENVEIEQ